MTPSMAIATDNIYKFATLFGLALLISVFLIGAYILDKYGELAFNKQFEPRILQSKENLLVRKQSRKIF
jgi:hypothetical protein